MRLSAIMQTMASNAKTANDRNNGDEVSSAQDAIDTCRSDVTPTMTSESDTQPAKSVYNDINERRTHVNEVLEDFVSATSLAGLSRVYNASSRISRMFWVTVIATCIAMFSWGISEHLGRYFSYPKKVTVEMVSEPVPFPSVTVCNMRSLDFDVLNRINEMLINDSTAMSYVNQTFDDEPFIGEYFQFIAKFSNMWQAVQAQSSVDMRIVTALDEALSRTGLYAAIDDDHIIQNASIKAEQYIVTCNIGGAKCNVARDFHLHFDPHYFNCYTYHEPDSLPANKDNPDDMVWLTPGLDNGLSMVLLTGSGMLMRNDAWRYIPGLWDRDSPFSGGDGVRVIIHDPAAVPLPLAEGFDVPPGFSASFGVRPRHNIRIGPPHGNCRSGKLWTVDGSVELEYDQLTCQQLCVQKYVVFECNCYDETLPFTLNVDGEEEDRGPRTCHDARHIPDHCRFYADDACFRALLEQYERVQCSREMRDKVRLNRDIIADCDCRPKCEQLVYDVSYSLSAWPADGFEGDIVLRDILIVRNFTRRFLSETQEDQLRSLFLAGRYQLMKNFARINVYIADPEVLVTRETPDYKLSQLISDIGGQQGIWLGLSLISVAEVVHLLGQILDRVLANERRRTARSRSRRRNSIP